MAKTYLGRDEKLPDSVGIRKTKMEYRKSEVLIFLYEYIISTKKIIAVAISRYVVRITGMYELLRLGNTFAK